MIKKLDSKIRTILMPTNRRLFNVLIDIALLRCAGLYYIEWRESSPIYLCISPNMHVIAVIAEQVVNAIGGGTYALYK